MSRPSAWPLICLQLASPLPLQLPVVRPGLNCTAAFRHTKALQSSTPIHLSDFPTSSTIIKGRHLPSFFASSAAVAQISNYQNTARLTALALSQSPFLGQTRTVSVRKSVPRPSDLSRPSIGNSTSVRLGPSVRKIQYQGEFPMASDYSARLQATHQIRPHSPSPATGTARSDLAKVQLRAFSSRMVSQSVNKTALHPGGVEYVCRHLSSSYPLAADFGEMLTQPLTGLPVSTRSSKRNFTPPHTSTMTV